MNRQAAIRILLLGKSLGSVGSLREFLDGLGCECSFAKSPADGVIIFGPGAFDLILDTLPAAAHASLYGLGSSSCNIFRSHQVENGCWWIPVVSAGMQCLGAPAMRPKEFAEILGKMLSEETPRKVAAAAV
jgi:hypothetical protein